MKKKLFPGFTAIAITVIFTMAGCTSMAEFFKPAEFPEFPSELVGTWERVDQSKLLIFTPSRDNMSTNRSTMKDSSQSYYFVLNRISGDIYNISPNYDTSLQGNVIIKLVGSNLEIPDDYLAGNPKYDWTGTWRRVLTDNSPNKVVEAQSNKGGEFTLTNIPSKYNGKYAVLYGDDDLVGCDSIKPLKPSRIIDGKVILPMWIARNGIEFERYSGNYQAVPGYTPGVYIHIYIMEKDNDITDLEEGPDDWIEDIDFTDHRLRSGREVFNSVSFSNGNATRSYNDRNQN